MPKSTGRAFVHAATSKGLNITSSVKSARVIPGLRACTVGTLRSFLLAEESLRVFVDPRQPHFDHNMDDQQQRVSQFRDNVGNKTLIIMEQCSTAGSH